MAEDQELVSVIIGVYNGAPYIAEAIDSVLAQTYDDYELIVIDDGSDDGTAEIVKGYGDRLVYRYQERRGMGAGRNHGVELSRGSFLTFLDADDRFTPHKLEKQVAEFRRDPSLEVVFGHIDEFISPDLPPERAARLRPPQLDAPWPTPNLMLVRREAFDRVGPFSTELKVGIGVDWYARAMEHGLKSTIPNAVVLERRLHAQNNGIRERDNRIQYVRVLKASLDRRRAAAAEREGGSAPDA
jgi:glycosyltransferase involved in cell wall biosynthesis